MVTCTSLFNLCSNRRCKKHIRSTKPPKKRSRKYSNKTQKERMSQKNKVLPSLVPRAHTLSSSLDYGEWGGWISMIVRLRSGNKLDFQDGGVFTSSGRCFLLT